MIFIVACISFDMICSTIHLPEWIYRLTAIRYVFLIYLGMIWVQKEIRINIPTVFLSLVTIVATLFFYYSDTDLQPLFFNTGWKTHRWICYFYVANILPCVLYKLYVQFSRIEWLNKLIIKIGKSSYEIFLVQMAVFVFLPFIFNHLSLQEHIRLILLFLSEVTISVLGGIYYRTMIWR